MDLDFTVSTSAISTITSSIGSVMSSSTRIAGAPGHDVMIKASRIISSGSSRRGMVAKLKLPMTRNTTINASTIDLCVSAKCGKFITAPR